MTASIRFSAVLDELSHALLWVRRCLEEGGVPSKAMARLELAAEEAIVNIIHHGYRGQGGVIELQSRKRPGAIEISFIDWGPPFNPLEKEVNPDRSSSLDEREEGGLGIFLIRQSVEELRYTRDGEKNVLTFVMHSSRTR